VVRKVASWVGLRQICPSVWFSANHTPSASPKSDFYFSTIVPKSIDRKKVRASIITLRETTNMI